jgi:hypothetical protein
MEVKGSGEKRRVDADARAVQESHGLTQRRRVPLISPKQPQICFQSVRMRVQVQHGSVVSVDRMLKSTQLIHPIWLMFFLSVSF